MSPDPATKADGNDRRRLAELLIEARAKVAILRLAYYDAVKAEARAEDAYYAGADKP